MFSNVKKNLLCIIAFIILTLTVTVRGQSDEVVKSDVSFNSNNNTGWMVTAIVFIILFAITLAACIYLCVERRRRLQQFYKQRQQLHGMKSHHHHHQHHQHPRSMDGGVDGYF